MRNDVSVGSVVIYDKSKYSGEMFGTLAVCDMCSYVNVVRYIVYRQAVNVCGQVYCVPADCHSGSE